ncbi:MAG: hypothetical protein ACR2P5_03290 [Gammaproteobacteria bacterium]
MSAIERRLETIFRLANIEGSIRDNAEGYHGVTIRIAHADMHRAADHLASDDEKRYRAKAGLANALRAQWVLVNELAELSVDNTVLERAHSMYTLAEEALILLCASDYDPTEVAEAFGLARSNTTETSRGSKK